MNTEQDTQTSEAAAPVLEAGTILKNRRESLGLTQQQVSSRLKLRVSLIQQIEDNQFDSDQVATFMRGYVRSYAKYVNLDEKVVLEALDHAGDVQHQEQEMMSFSRKTKTEKHNSRIMLLTWSIFAVIAGISSLWWWQNQQQDTLSQSFVAEETAEEVVVDDLSDDQLTTSLDLIEAETPVVEAPQVVDSEVMAEASVATETIAADVAPEVEVPAEPVVATVETEVAEPEVVIPEPVSNELVMQFSSDCWIQVKDATGRTLSTGIKKAGQSLNLSGETPYKVVIGAPEAVSMTFASEPVDLSGYTSGKVARITLP
ncbi:cytoskeleton protein RodZ [Vibrio sp. THAF190c]|uniref:cytoskeleton protein RodZ n=1 Tax=Vibrio sp. THAF190c TaxID=2587865 RepID=UPI001268FEFA|nr:cytoskeleton protein RodZ [Vibrio sp. THAF190c]QFT08931.1 Cytoskeleton protein RodZ [Vibrio sp. THAF190c]